MFSQTVEGAQKMVTHRHLTYKDERPVMYGLKDMHLYWVLVKVNTTYGVDKWTKTIM